MDRDTCVPSSGVRRLVMAVAAIAAALSVLTSGLMPAQVQARSARGGPAPGQQFSPEVQQQLNATFAQYLQKMHAAGGVAGVWIPGRGSWEAAMGTANPATGEPMSLADHMRVGSITKSMTITAILELMDRGKLSLDDPISKYVSGVPNGDRISLRLLGNMRSGLFNYSEDISWARSFEANPYQQWTPRQLLAYAWKHKPYFPPNQGYHYSNTNTILLGLVIRTISREPLARFFQQHLFRPLGMSHSLLANGPEFPAPYAHGTTLLESPRKVVDAAHFNPSWAWSAGGAVSTLDDLHMWAHAVGTGALISRRAQAARLQFEPIAPGGSLEYGLAVARRNGWIWHNGNLPGYSSYFGYLPALHAMMAVSLTTDIPYQKVGPGDVLANALSRIVTPDHSPAAGGKGNE